MTIFIKKTKVFTWSAEICSARQNATFHNRMLHQTVDKTLLVSTPEAFFLFWVQKVCT